MVDFPKKPKKNWKKSDGLAALLATYTHTLRNCFSFWSPKLCVISRSRVFGFVLFYEWLVYIYLEGHHVTLGK